MKFKDMGLSPQLLDTINRMNYITPTLIQMKSIPHILKGNNVVGESATGSGKTLAFGCGIVERVLPKKGLQALILTPTRELCQQVKEELRVLSNGNLNILAVYGGVSINKQISKLDIAEVVVATPGRLLDHINRNTVNLSQVKILVLDEADRMLDMGFIDDVEKIVQRTPKNKQTLFFSATISFEIEDIIEKYMNNPITVSGIKMVDPSKLKQVYYDISKNMKLALLVHLLKHERSGLVMVFCNTRRNVDFVVKNLRINGLYAIAIHGGLTQNKRSRTMDSFNESKVHILVCTDVASRGLHIENVSHIYNYDVPHDAKDYVHRIGRTARAGEEGKVINVLCEFDHDNFRKIRDRYSEFSIECFDTPYLKRVNMTSSREDHDNYPRWHR
ncbi:MAG: DEAD/DEAH box helicase [Candidatus Woesearchaeota archaeon]|nr:MAG: DEAD/DEAH box helicase [Candidatus Woesearchaeota archaeon]